MLSRPHLRDYPLVLRAFFFWKETLFLWGEKIVSLIKQLLFSVPRTNKEYIAFKKMGNKKDTLSRKIL